MSIMYLLGLSSLIFAYFTLQIMVRLSIVVSEKITKVDFPSLTSRRMVYFIFRTDCSYSL